MTASARFVTLEGGEGVGKSTQLKALATALAARGIQGGLDLLEYYPELGPALLVCATETKSAADIELYARVLAEVLRAARAA